MRISEMESDPQLKRRYLEIAHNYLKVAEAEQALAQQLEVLSATSADPQSETKLK